MTYKLRFLPAALKEWEKLGAPIKSQFKKKLGRNDWKAPEYWRIN